MKVRLVFEEGRPEGHLAARSRTLLLRLILKCLGPRRACVANRCLALVP
jgi:hypothetical protein